MLNFNKAYRLLVFFLALLAMGIVLTDCGGGGGGYAPASPGTTTGTVEVIACQASGTTDVSITGSSFVPASTSIAINGIVKWTNNDGITHTVTSTTVPTGGSFDRTVASGVAVCMKFTGAGTFNYHCTIHPSMVGSVVVQ